MLVVAWAFHAQTDGAFHAQNDGGFHAQTAAWMLHCRAATTTTCSYISYTEPEFQICDAHCDAIANDCRNPSMSDALDWIYTQYVCLAWHSGAFSINSKCTNHGLPLVF